MSCLLQQKVVKGQKTWGTNKNKKNKKKKTKKK